MCGQESGVISYAEFRDFCDVVSFSYERLRNQSYVERRYPELWVKLRGERTRQVVRNRWFSRAVTFILIVNTAVILAESFQDLNNGSGPSPDTWGCAHRCADLAS